MEFSRLTPNFDEDPHAEAARFAVGERPVKAISVLRAAIARQPERHDLHVHLRRLELDSMSGVTRSSGPARISNLIVAVHLMVAWVLFIGLLVSLLVGPLYILRPLLPSLESPAQSVSNTAIVLGFLAAIACCVTALAIAVKLFCRFWFTYLRCLPELHALAADVCLPSVMRTSGFGEAYSRSRQQFFSKRYGSINSA